jgi:hypothetical protein
LSVDISNSLLTTVTWTAYYANTADTFGTLASPTRTQIATGTFTVSSTLTNYSTQISIPAAATTGIEVVFTVGAQTSGTWVIGNVQLEKSSIATSFDYRSYGTELALCQRYFEKSANQAVAILTANDSGYLITNLYNNIATGNYYATVTFAVSKRVNPTVVLYPYTTPTNLTRWSNDVGADYGANSATTPNGPKEWGFNVSNTSGGTLTVGTQKIIIGNWYASAEL